MPRLVGYGPTDDADGEKNRADGGDRGYARKPIQARNVCHDGRTDQDGDGPCASDLVLQVAAGSHKLATLATEGFRRTL